MLSVRSDVTKAMVLVAMALLSANALSLPATKLSVSLSLSAVCGTHSPTLDGSSDLFLIALLPSFSLLSAATPILRHRRAAGQR